MSAISTARRPVAAASRGWGATTAGIDEAPGSVVGQEAEAKKAKEEGKQVIMVRPETKPDDVHGMLAARGILTSSGGRTSHAALVARQFGKPAVVGAGDLEIDLEGDVDGHLPMLLADEGLEVMRYLSDGSGISVR